MKNLLRYAQKHAEPDEKVIKISPFCVMRLFPDGSAILYKNQTGKLEQIVLARSDIEFIQQLRLPIRQFTPGPENEKDVHTEHCCIVHGCKYGLRRCPVSSEKKKQSGPCQSCWEETWM